MATGSVTSGNGRENVPMVTLTLKLLSDGIIKKIKIKKRENTLSLHAYQIINNVAASTLLSCCVAEWKCSGVEIAGSFCCYSLFAVRLQSAEGQRGRH